MKKVFSFEEKEEEERKTRFVSCSCSVYSLWLVTAVVVE